MIRRLALVALALPLLAGCSRTSSERLPNEGGGPQRNVPRWVARERLPANAIPGARLFAVAGCTACHRYLGSGTTELSAPDLTAEGARNSSIEFQIHHLRCPSCVHPRSSMPPFDGLGPKRLRQVAIFLVASKGSR